MAFARVSGTNPPLARRDHGRVLIWSLAPIVLVIISLLQLRHSSHIGKGFGLRWWVGKPRREKSIVYDRRLRAALADSLALASWTTLIAALFGTAFALGCWGWRSRIRGWTVGDVDRPWLLHPSCLV